MNFSEVLSRQQPIDPSALTRAIQRYGDTPQMGGDLVQQRAVSPAAYARALAEYTHTPFLDVEDIEQNLDPAVVNLIPVDMCYSHNVMPLQVSGDHLVLAMADPTDILAVDDAASVSNKIIDPVVVAQDALQMALSRYVRSDEELNDLTEQISETARQISESELTSVDEDDVPVVRFVNLLIPQAINDRASDIHLEPGGMFMKVRFRIDGVLKEAHRVERAIQDGIISRIKIMAQIDIAERRIPQDGRLSIDHDGRQVDLRVATLPTVWGEKIVMRILDSPAAHLRLKDLRFSEDNLSRFSTATSRANGMVLITGPTGSGKSTTLYTALRGISTDRINVITVEDPVEYRIQGINQVQVNPRAGLTFATALRSILRSDPDVVLVGEIRDQETAMMSIEAALTGHLVLSTLHTNDAPSAVTRLIEMGSEPFLVSSALSAVVAQRLARRLCTYCREPLEDVESVRQAAGMPEFPSDQPLPTLYRAVGCPVCAGTGYRGRLGLHEVMTITEEIGRLASRNVSSAEIRELAIAQGMVPLREDGWAKVIEGLTTIEEVLRVTT